jgi:hypothetical protein
MTTVVFPGSSSTDVYGINGAGTIVGSAFFQSTSMRVNFMRDWSGNVTTFEGGFVGVGINDLGQVVGTLDFSAFVRDPDGSFSTFRVPGAPNEPVFARDINNAGVVVGYTGPGAFGFQATPISEPSALALTVCGGPIVLGFLRVRRRQRAMAPHCRAQPAQRRQLCAVTASP